MKLPLDVATLTAGQRAWFVRHDDHGVSWALVRPWDDGSAAIRTEKSFRTFPPPNGPREAVVTVEAEGYVHLVAARMLLGIAHDMVPPNW